MDQALMIMTAAQKRVLMMLLEGARETTKTTHHQYISGRCAQALINRGWAKWSSRAWYDVHGGWVDPPPQTVEITLLGRIALASIGVGSTSTDTPNPNPSSNTKE